MTEEKMKVLQNWWHIEYQFSPIPANKICQVMDIILLRSCKSEHYRIPLKFKGSFMGLRVFARNCEHNEVAFLEITNPTTQANGESTMMASIDYDQLPIIKFEGVYYYHLKLELEYFYLKSPDIISYNSSAKIITRKLIQDKKMTNRIYKESKSLVETECKLAARSIEEHFLCGHDIESSITEILEHTLPKITDELNQISENMYNSLSHKQKIKYSKSAIKKAVNNCVITKIKAILQSKYLRLKYGNAKYYLKVVFSGIEFMMHKLINIIFPYVEVMFGLGGLYQPEYYITTPMGWELSSISENNKFIAQKSNVFGGIDKIEYNLNPPIILRTEDNKRKYHYLINDNDMIVFDGIKMNENYNMRIFYKMRMTLPIILFQYLPFVFVILSSLCLVVSLNLTEDIVKWFLPATLSISVILLGYYYTYMRLEHNGYQFPYKNMMRFLIIISAIVVSGVVIGILGSMI